MSIELLTNAPSGARAIGSYLPGDAPLSGKPLPEQAAQQAPLIGRAPLLSAENKTETAAENAGTFPRKTETAAENAGTFPRKTDQEIADAVRAINDVVQSQNLALKFHRDDDTGSLVIELIDQTSGESIRQIPSESALRLSAALGRLQGNLVNAKV
jgi:flagellar protein FlaG